MRDEALIISVSNQEIGPDREPWIVAEMSANHNGSLERAFDIIDQVAASGAHALKLQTYTPETMTLNIQKKGFVIETHSLWQGRSLYDLYEEAQTPWGWHRALFDRCRERGLVGFSSPFDESAVELLEDLQVPLYKVASLEILDHPLLRAIAATRKPIIMSTGAATLYEIEEAVNVIEKASGGPIVLLKCTTAYPAPFDEANLRTLEHMRAHFGKLVGLSDHTLGLATSLVAVAMGACVIEKHVTLSRADGGLDSAFSLEPSELKQLKEESRAAWQTVGRVTYGPTKGEALFSHTLRRSLYVAKSVQAGEKIDGSSVRAIRPGAGLSPKHWEALQGREFSKDLEIGTALGWDCLKPLHAEPSPYLSSSSPRVVAIVQARMGSTRLPGKVLLPLQGRSMLEWIIYRLKSSKKIDEVILAVPDSLSNDILEVMCHSWGIRCVRGSEEDVLDRYLRAAESSRADVVVRITSDCPLVDPQLLDELIEQYLAVSATCHGLSNAIERTYPRGLDIEIVATCALLDLCSQGVTDGEREHVTLGLYNRPLRYKWHRAYQALDQAHYRWTVDSALDYGYIDRIYSFLAPAFEEQLKRPSTSFSWTGTVLDLLTDHSDWSHFNALEKQKKV